MTPSKAGRSSGPKRSTSIFSAPRNVTLAASGSAVMPSRAKCSLQACADLRQDVDHSVRPSAAVPLACSCRSVANPQAHQAHSAPGHRRRRHREGSDSCRCQRRRPSASTCRTPTGSCRPASPATRWKPLPRTRSRRHPTPPPTPRAGPPARRRPSVLKCRYLSAPNDSTMSTVTSKVNALIRAYPSSTRRVLEVLGPDADDHVGGRLVPGKEVVRPPASV